MKRITTIAAICAACSGGALFADFSYDQTSQMTGGFLTRMPAMLGGNKMREPQRSTILLKGNRLAHINADHTSIIDLDKEAMIDINYKDKSYSITTFAEMKQMMESMQSRKKGADDPNVEYSIDVKQTGQSKVIAGYNATETIMTFKMKSTDPRTGKEGAMTMLNDMWLVKSVPGYDEVREFYKRMSQKASWIPEGGGGPMAGPAAGMGQAMSAAMKNAQKMEGVPVLHVMKMRPEGDDYNSAMAQAGDAQKQGESAQQQQQQQAPPQQQQSAPEQSAASAITGRFGRGLAGGLGGLRKKKNDQQDAPPAQQQQSQPAANRQAPAAGDNSLMEMTIESSAFSNASVDGSKMEIPAGFKEVKKRMGR